MSGGARAPCARGRAQPGPVRFESGQQPGPLRSESGQHPGRLRSESGQQPGRLRSESGEATSGLLRAESGQALLLMLGVAAAILVGALVLTAFGKALGAKGRHQRVADLAAISAARVMRDNFERLFEPPVIDGVPNPHRLSTVQYEALARRAALRAALRNGVPVAPWDVRFPLSFAPTRVTVITRGAAAVRVQPGGRHSRRPVAVRGRATASLAAPAGGGSIQPAQASGGGYRGPLAYRQGKPMRPDVARAFDRMAAAARREAGLTLTVTSGFRSDAEQARLFAAHPDPKWVARPGTSLHRLGTELDLGSPAAYGWLRANGRRFGFVQRYSWEPWHWGFSRNPGSTSVGFGRQSAARRPGPGTRGGPATRRAGTDAGQGRALQSFVPAALQRVIVGASQRRNISAALLAAQLYAESGYNPYAVSPSGARGIAQFMPGTARAYGLADPFDPAAAIDAQARLMRDLLRRFASVPLALAAYNAGAGAVSRCGCVPPYPETQAYVARILGLLGGAGELPLPLFQVRLVQ